MNTRKIVLHHLIKWSSSDDKRAMQRIIGLVSDPTARISIVALEALGSIARKGDQVVIAVIKSNLSNSNTLVKYTAEVALPKVAKGDAQTINTFCAELHSGNFEVCIQAIKVLGQIAENGDPKVLEELLSFCSGSGEGTPGSSASDRRWSEQDDRNELAQCKASAVLALGKVANKGDRLVMEPLANALFKSMRDRDCRLAEAACRSLARLTDKGDKWSLKILSSVFDRSLMCPFARSLRILVLSLLGDIGEGGDPFIFKIALAQLTDEDLEVRTQAVRTAGKTFHPEYDHGTKQLSSFTEGCGDALLRREAQIAMERIDSARIQHGPKKRGCICAVM